MNIKNFYKISVACLMMTALTACVMTKEERFAKDQSVAKASEDPVMINAILEVSKNSKYKATVNKRHISLEIYNNLHENQISDAIETYRHQDSTTDRVAQQYVATAKKRGHRIAMYNAKINKAILRLYNQGAKLKGDHWRYDLDNALVEYDKNNRIVSVMVRLNAFMIPIGAVLHEQTTRFYLSSDARYIESKIAKKLFEDNFITNI